MEILAAAATSEERLIRRLKISLIESRTMRLGDAWNLDLCSPFWRLYDHDRAGASLKYRGKHLPMAKGELWMIPAWVPFQTAVSREVVQNYLHFEVRGMPWWIMRDSFVRPVRLPAHQAVTTVCRQWKMDLHSADHFTHLCWATVLANAAVAAVLVRKVAAADRPWRQIEEMVRIQPAMDCLQERTVDPASNQELAALCGMSEDHFIRRFREIVGMTPARYGREHRITLAAEWLTSTNRTFEDIAEAGGFTDRFHFSRVFKIRFGQAPGAYRKMHRREFVAWSDRDSPADAQIINMQSP